MLEVVVRNHALGHMMPDSDDLYPGQGLGVIVTGVFVADFNDLAAVIHSAMTAHEVRALWLMTLRAFHGRYRV